MAVLGEPCVMPRIKKELAVCKANVLILQPSYRHLFVNNILIIQLEITKFTIMNILKRNTVILLIFE